jgi:hypothetical protein
MCQQILAELPDIIFHENPFGGSQVVNVDRRTFKLTDMARLISTFLATLSCDRAYDQF